MKKQRIGVYNKKVLVAGDKNLAGPNELHISKVSGDENSGGGSSNNQNLIYYKNNRFDDKGLSQFYYLFSCTPIIEMLVGDNLNNDDSLALTFVTNPLWGGFMNMGDDRFIVGFVIDTSKSYLCSAERLFVNTSGTMQQRYQQIIDFLNNDTEYDNQDIISAVNEEWNLWNSAFTEITKEEYESLITIKYN